MIYDVDISLWKMNGRGCSDIFKHTAKPSNVFLNTLDGKMNINTNRID